jgi:hypothetical protein
MRTLAVIVLSAMFFYGGIDCYSQDLCSAIVVRKPDEKPLPPSEITHEIMLSQNTTEKRRTISLEDVEFILKCGTLQDATELFAALRNTSVPMPEATIVQASEYAIRVSWYDGFKHFEAFRFNFVTPLTAIPGPGDKVLISGTYSSWSRDPFQINMTNPSFRLLQPQHRAIIAKPSPKPS